MSLSPNAFTVSNVVTDALFSAIVKMSPKILPYRDDLVPYSKPTADSGKLVIFVGYDKEENASIIKTWSEYLLKGEYSIFILTSKDTPNDSILVSIEYAESLMENYSPSADMYYMPAQGDSHSVDSLVGQIELNYFDYLIIESASLLKASPTDILESLRKVTSGLKGNVIISMTPDEFALIEDKVDLFDVIVRK